MSTLAAIKLVAVLMIAGLLFFGGRSCGVQSAHERNAAQARVMAAKDRALQAASRSFTAFAATFRSIDAHTVAQLAEARRRAELAEYAGGRAAAAEADTALRTRLLEQDLAEARRRRPACAQLFPTDLGDACGVTLR
ncbi:hypothetical protein [Luteimonas notoginsengisoli]|uniref:Uncharacterized protein n=1 Tax=Luteimonas notoginsengisoli TaxID=1578200 RepID=A0ABV7URV1_9GAMM